MICMEARRAAEAIKSRRIKSDEGDAWALAEMLRTGWFSSVCVKSVDTAGSAAAGGGSGQLRLPSKIRMSLASHISETLGSARPHSSTA